VRNRKLECFWAMKTLSQICKPLSGLILGCAGFEDSATLRRMTANAVGTMLHMTSRVTS